MTDRASRAAYMQLWRSRQTPEKQAEMNAKVLALYHERKEFYAIAKRKYHLKHRLEYNLRAKARRRRLKDDPTEREKQKHHRKRTKAKLRNHIKHQSSPQLTLAEWESILSAWEYRCAYCSMPSSSLEQEHVHPLSRGGEHTIDNVVPACRRCNMKKGSRTLAEFYLAFPSWPDEELITMEGPPME
jgi:5-methylcytosine-specific restriction endonuclease McrA